MSEKYMKGIAWRRAAADMRKLAQQYDIEAANTTDTEKAAELRDIAKAQREAADALKPRE